MKWLLRLTGDPYLLLGMVFKYYNNKGINRKLDFFERAKYWGFLKNTNKYKRHFSLNIAFKLNYCNWLELTKLQPPIIHNYS